MPPRRSARLHPQIQPTEQGARVACRRSPRLRPQIQPSEEDARVTRRGCRRRGGTSSTVAAASLPDDDDMLREILLRLPPQPSSLPRASAVCKRWRGLVTDPRFHHQFYAHHRKPPVLGVFSCGSNQGIVFTPILDPPYRIPPQHFNLGRCSSYDLLDCRHGLVLVEDTTRTKLVVRDPITREQHWVAIPSELKTRNFNGAVLCAAGDVHGGCHSSPFKVVLMSVYNKYNPPFTRVYSSETAIWGDRILTENPCDISRKPAVLVGNCLYWLSMGHDILELDIGESSQTVIRGPPVTIDILFGNCQIIHAENGAVGCALLSCSRFEMWQRNINVHGVATWVLSKRIEMHTILRLPSKLEGMYVQLLGYDEDDAILLCYDESIYMVQLKSTQSRKLNEIHSTGNRYFPFKSFFTPGTTIGGEFNGAEMLHDA